MRSGVRIALMTGGPTVSIGQNTPSMTSMWTSSTPARSRSRHLVAEVGQVGGDHPDRQPGTAAEEPLERRAGHRVASAVAHGRLRPAELAAGGPGRSRTPRPARQPSWTTLRTAWSIAIGASLWKMLRPMSTPGGAAVDRAAGHRQRVELGQLLAAGHDDRHRAAGGDLLEVLLAVVGLDDLGAELGADPGGEAEVAGVADELLADRGHARGRGSRAGSPRRPAGSCCGRVWVSNSPPTKTWTAIADGAEPDGVVDVERDLLVRELLEDARPAARAQDEALLDRRRDDASGGSRG